MKPSPLAKKIKTSDGYYIYDVFQNEILPVDEITFELFEPFFQVSREAAIRLFHKKYKAEEILATWTYLKEKTSQGYFSLQRPGWDSDSLFQIKKDGRGQVFRELVLIPCADCNLRCKYCSFSGSYYFNRRHENKKMSVDTAEKAMRKLQIPEIYKNVWEGHHIHFFGGEPLLNMNVIKACKKEANRLSQEGIQFKFIVETNGKLLTPDVADYLAKENIFLTVSLDGPKELHDRYRIQKNGSGSFEAIIQNLKYIKKNYPGYYASISFNSVLEPPFYESMKNQMHEILDLVAANRITYSRISTTNTSFYTAESLNRRNQYLDHLRDTFIESMVKNDGEEEFFLKSYFYKYLKRSFLFLIKDKEKKEIKKKICFLGGQKGLVDPDGNLTPCIEYWTRGIHMGNLDTGLNVDLLDHYTREFCDRVIPHCQECWLIRHCPLCPPIFLGKDAGKTLITPENREQLCQKTQEKYLKDLQMTLTLIERKPSSLKYMENFRVLKDILPIHAV